MRTLLQAACFAVIAAALVPPAYAQHVDDVQAARDHYARGKRLYDLGRFADAAKEYDAAYQAKDDPALLFNLGQAHRLAGDYRQALLAYKAYLRNVPDPPNRSEVEARIAEIQSVVDQQAGPSKSRPQGTTEPKPPAPATSPLSAESPPTNALVASPPPPRKSLAKKPWFWAAVIGAGAVIATGIAIGVVYGKQDPTPSAGKVVGP